MKSKKVKYTDFTPDSVVQSTINKFVDRAEMGFNKYNATLDRNDLTPVEWVEHLQDELMDGILYLTKLKQVINSYEKEKGENTKGDSKTASSGT